MPDDHYTHGHEAPVLRSHAWRTAANSAAYLLPHLAPGLSVLDVGSGPGTITRDLARLVAPGRVVGVDRDPGVVALAGAAAAVSGDDAVASTGDDAAPSVAFQVADAYELPFDDGEFDIVHAHQVLQHLSDPVAALGEMARVTRPGGLVAARDSDYGALTWYPPSRGLDLWRTIYTAVARANDAEPDAGRHLLAWAHAAGFFDVTPSSSTWCFATPADRAWWGELWAQRTTTTAYGRQAVALGLTDEAGLATIADAWANWAADEDGWITIVAGEILVRVPEAPFRGGQHPDQKWWARRDEALTGVGAGGPGLPKGPRPGSSDTIAGAPGPVTGE
ncbi:MAG: methyltransferase domain-containing protein [Bifidobacteriaceae bacterium]|jgi:SAM-dependent methyltransferase|nr:methyltransferase domain-containing protein [Bifidobacteriaceae bacterium]